MLLSNLFLWFYFQKSDYDVFICNSLGLLLWEFRYFYWKIFMISTSESCKIILTSVSICCSYLLIALSYFIELLVLDMIKGFWLNPDIWVFNDVFRLLKSWLSAVFHDNVARKSGKNLIPASNGQQLDSSLHFIGSGLVHGLLWWLCGGPYSAQEMLSFPSLADERRDT